ncbi:MAG: glycosyltransferase family 4 protein [Alphaproteobacteria bacterium]|nr:glycosyltransferase family 4 protein [Alphaproteobacteria bacterium]
MTRSLALTWALSTVSGYGIYGLQIALELIRQGADKIILTHRPAAIMLPPLTQVKLDPILTLARKISEVMQKQPNETLAFDHPVLHAVGNDFSGFVGQDRVNGNPNIGCAAIEHKVCSPHAREVAKNYSMLIAISRWNERFLNELDLGPVHLCYQGIDTSIFYPGPRSGLWKDRFVVFSGGKFEFRKGQDIVIAAFKIFREKHPESLLVTCWQNLLPLDPAPFKLAGHCADLPVATDQGLQIAPWLIQQGLPPGSFITLPYTPNMLMPFALRECDIAIFPNRCEGGTNLVAMEAMACGIPTFVSNNTGQTDLIDLLDCGSFNTQKPVISPPGASSFEDWGETEVEEVVAALEKTYTQHEAAKNKAATISENIKAYDWSTVNKKLLDVVFR